nr:immunoglobulin light chain junction region [Macaca mulatta]
LQQYNDLVFTF